MPVSKSRRRSRYKHGIYDNGNVYIPYILTGRWTAGRPLCVVWLVVDYVVCTASTLNIMLISWDRYMLVTRGLGHQGSQTTKKGVIRMVMVWMLAFLLYGPAIIFWEYIAGERVVPDDQCYVEFYDNFPFKLTAAIMEFLTPLISISYFNLSIYLNIRWRSRGGFLNSEKQTNCFSLCRSAKISPAQRQSGSNVHPSTISHHSALSRDKKTAKSLAILVGVFSLCWTLYTFLSLIISLCQDYIFHIFVYSPVEAVGLGPKPTLAYHLPTAFQYTHSAANDLG
uniref:Histamine H3 receptor-like n=1 Tax=Saccoglossus kowalevskii TaxID=10224 RepID=A0ABM0LZE3_SACKO